jgi:hypothetical protein
MQNLSRRPFVAVAAATATHIELIRWFLPTKVAVRERRRDDVVVIRG